MIRRFAIAVLLLGIPLVSLASTYTVNPNGTGTFPNIQAAIDADYVVDGDVIELISGVFTGAGNRDVSFRGKGITVKSQSGDPETCVIDCEADQNDRHRGFKFQSGEGLDSVLDGVTIRNGFVFNHGGGIHCEAGASPTIRNCILENCHAEAFDTANGKGGGVFLSDASPQFFDCVFKENYSNENGGGMFMQGDSAPLLIGCLFQDNETFYIGGGLYGGGFTAEDCWFVGNRSLCCDGGGMSAGAGAVIDRCYFYENEADWGAGGSFGAVLLNECVFFGNEGDLGGAFACYNFSAQVENCTFVGNSAPLGAGIYIGGDASAGGSILNTIIADNLQGAAIECGGSGAPTLICSDIHGNSGGDYVGCIASELGVNDNISLDPLFCDTFNPDDPFTLHDTSPCSPENSPCGELIGARPVGCGVTASIDMSWSAFKALY